MENENWQRVEIISLLLYPLRMGMIELEDIIGKQLVSGNAKMVGKVVDIAIDVVAWRIPAISVSINKGNEVYLNKKKKFVGTQTAMVKTESIRSVTDMIALNENLEDLGKSVIEDFKSPVTMQELIGKKVLCKQGKEIGFVHGFKADFENNWNVPFIDVEVEKATIEELKIKKKLGVKPMIKLRTVDIRSLADVVLLDIDLEEVRSFLENKPVSRVS
jgi:sporulation protein YlmC with PRC-barrel domain